MGRCLPQERVFRAALSTPVTFREMSKYISVYIIGLITKADFILPYFCTICSSVVQCDFLFGDAQFKFDNCVFLRNNQNFWLRIATNEYLLQFV